MRRAQLAVRANDAGVEHQPEALATEPATDDAGRPTIVVVQQLLLECSSMPVILIAVGFVSSGFLVGLTIGKPWSLVTLPLLGAGALFLLDPMQLVSKVPLVLLWGSAGFGGAWSGLTMHRSVQRSISRRSPSRDGSSRTA